jgi:hypothetical protein
MFRFSVIMAAAAFLASLLLWVDSYMWHRKYLVVREDGSRFTVESAHGSAYVSFTEGRDSNVPAKKHFFSYENPSPAEDRFGVKWSYYNPVRHFTSKEVGTTGPLRTFVAVSYWFVVVIWPIFIVLIAARRQKWIPWKGRESPRG